MLQVLDYRLDQERRVGECIDLAHYLNLLGHHGVVGELATDLLDALPGAVG